MRRRCGLKRSVVGNERRVQVTDRVQDALTRAGKTSRDKHAVPSWFGRAGLVGRGLLYVVVGFLAVRVAFGDASSKPDQKGALAAVASQPFGRLMVLGLGVLFASYAIYRLTEAALDPDDDHLVQRVAAALRGLLYVALAFTAWSIALGGSSGGSEGTERDATVRALDVPGGRWLVAATGLGIIGAGLWHGWRAATGRFAKDLKEDEMPDAVERVMLVGGTIGSLARGIAFVLVGGFLTNAGVSHDPSKPVGLDESLAELASAPAGTGLLSVVGVGLAAYGLFAVGRARYQRIMGQ